MNELHENKALYANLFHSLVDECSYITSPLVKSTSSFGEVDGNLING